MKIKAEKHILEFGSRQITYRLHRADRKRLRIVVSPELMVDVYAPRNTDNEKIRIALQKKASWIARTLDKLESYHPLPIPKRYISGETLVYLGRQYRLKVVKGSKQPAKLAGRFLSTFFYALLTRCQPDWRKRKEILDNISKID